MYSIYAVYGCSQRQVKADGKAAAQVAVAKYSADAKCTKIVVQKGDDKCTYRRTAAGWVRS